MATTYVEGSPYSAKFVAIPNDGEGTTFTYAIVKPPFTGSQRLYEEVISGEVEEYASTSSSSVLAITVQGQEAELAANVSDEEDATFHDRRVQLALDGVKSLISALNAIENGTFRRQ